MTDVRSKKVVFVAYCLLDQNARAKGIAKYSGPVYEVLETLIKKEVGIVQMPCPELLHEGFDRLPYPRNWYDTKELGGFVDGVRSRLQNRLGDTLNTSIRLWVL